MTNYKSPTTGDYTKLQPDIEKHCWAKISRWCHIIARAEYETMVKEGERKAVSSSKRILVCQGDAAQDVGCNAGYELPPVLNFTWPAMEHALTPACRLDALWSKMEPEEQSACYKYLELENYSQDDLAKADQSKVRKVIRGLAGR